MADYPDRPPFFAHRFVRLITKAAVAQELGPEVCWLLSIVVHTEDCKRYAGPVTFYNEQLLPLVGIGGRARLVRARQAAQEAGWLHYEPGARNRPGKYWVTIPAAYEGLPDYPVDQTPPPASAREANTPPVSVPNQNGNGKKVSKQNGIRTLSERNSRRLLSYTQTPNLLRHPPDEAEVAAYARALGVPDFDGVWFVAKYNANGWRDDKGAPVTNWRGLVEAWVRNERRSRQAGELSFDQYEAAHQRRRAHLADTLRPVREEPRTGEGLPDGWQAELRRHSKKEEG